MRFLQCVRQMYTLIWITLRVQGRNDDKSYLPRKITRENKNDDADGVMNLIY